MPKDFELFASQYQQWSADAHALAMANREILHHGTPTRNTPRAINYWSERAAWWAKKARIAMGVEE